MVIEEHYCHAQRSSTEWVSPAWETQRIHQRLFSSCFLTPLHGYLSTMEIAYLKLTPARKKEDPKNRDEFLTTLSILNQGNIINALPIFLGT
ncbi:uncharacterized protein LOC119864631 isoform X6 [Canis lupus familiaris]|nr:uncharacterized protein LOC119864631 isoform X6 [Canis lupus familiaris]